LHLADGVARAGDSTWAIVAVAAWDGADSDSQSEDRSEESLHSVFVDFCEERMV